VWSHASALAHPFLSPEFQAAERRSIRGTHLPGAETWVWEADGNVVGFISLIGNEIGGLFVEPTFHRTGIGRALIDRARALRGALEVEVFEMNQLGREFYARMGFEFICRMVHESTGLQVMRLRLAVPATGS